MPVSSAASPSAADSQKTGALENPGDDAAPDSTDVKRSAVPRSGWNCPTAPRPPAGRLSHSATGRGSRLGPVGLSDFSASARSATNVRCLRSCPGAPRSTAQPTTWPWRFCGESLATETGPDFIGTRSIGMGQTKGQTRPPFAADFTPIGRAPAYQYFTLNSAALSARV